MAVKKTKLFNEEFVFDDNNEGNSIQNAIRQQRKPKNVVDDVDDIDDDDEIGDFNGDVINDKKFQKLAKQPDQVRIKQSSVKKKAVEVDEFFDQNTEVGKIEIQFDDMNISKPLMKALSVLNFTKPTKIQSAVVPIALMGKDVVACAVTGSGKTLGFMLPTLERLLYRPKFPQVTRVLVLTPTRELAAQICKVTRDLSQFTNIQTCLCAGGFDIKAQEASLRLGPDICIATPGRLIDHLHNTPSFNLETVEILVLDEADRMLDDCFAEQLKEIMRLCARTRQTMLFSATMTEKVEDLVKVSLNKPVKVFINENVDVTPLLKQEFIRLRDDSEQHKQAVLAALITRKFNERVIIFVKTKVDCHQLCLLLNLLNIQASELHGSLSQAQRLEKLNEFKEEKINVLVATDLASRGLDIANVRTVVNYAMPMTFKHYIHRVGRTARAGKSGRSISMVTEKDRWLVKDIIRSSKIPVKSRVIPADVIKAYKDKVEAMQGKYHEALDHEKEEKLLEKMTNKLNAAEKRLKSDGKPNKKGQPLALKRTWLPNVDYKNGGLKKPKEKKAPSKKRTNRNDDDDDGDYNEKNAEKNFDDDGEMDFNSKPKRNFNNNNNKMKKFKKFKK